MNYFLSPTWVGVIYKQTYDQAGPGKNVVRLADHLNMIIAVDSGVKQKSTTKPQTNKHNRYLYLLCAIYLAITYVYIFFSHLGAPSNNLMGMTRTGY